MLTSPSFTCGDLALVSRWNINEFQGDLSIVLPFHRLCHCYWTYSGGAACVYFFIFFASPLLRIVSRQYNIAVKFNQHGSFDHHLTNMENYPKHCFCPPDSCCRHVPIENVTKICGIVYRIRGRVLTHLEIIGMMSWTSS